MSPARVLQIALILSLTAHTIVLAQRLNFSFKPEKKDAKPVDVRYVRVAPEEKKELLQSSAAARERLMPLAKTLTADDRNPPPFAGSESQTTGGGPPLPPAIQDEFFSKPVFDKTDVITIKKKITLPAVKQDTMGDNPSYMGYYQDVREKIKRAAYRAYTGRVQGEVAVSFILTSQGQLKVIKLLEERSASSPYLREIALRSVKSAAPFRAFPPELNFSELSFNVVITFEVE